MITENKVIVIAEAGVNHNGSVELAKQLIDVAVEAEADFVKFQSFKTENVVVRNAEKAEYQKQSSGSEETQFEMIKKLELDVAAHRELVSYCKQTKIQFLSTPFDMDSIALLDDLGLKIFKIPSGEITNLPHLRAIGSLKKEIILSTGISNLDEISQALDILVDSGTSKENITVLHANTEYPTPYEHANLRAMKTIGDRFDIKIGYSDHTLGIEVPFAAVGMGATVIEKHFTLDKTMEGPDHGASLEPHELIAMVRGIRNLERALGNGIKQPSPSEIKNINIVRRSIVALKSINKGEVFSNDNLTSKRPEGGISPMRWDEIIGKIAQKNYELDSLIEE
jgi:N,N'-diacetyllegionaminate synthase